MKTEGSLQYCYNAQLATSEDGLIVANMRRVSRFPPCTPVSVARWCPRPSKASEMYFRKIRPSAT